MRPHKNLASIPLFDPEAGTVIRGPYENGEGHWAGAPYAYYDRELDRFFLYYRLRQPRPIRGGEVRIAASRTGADFEDVLIIRKEELRSESMERGSMLRCLDGLFRLYISYVDPADRRWRIDMMEANHPSAFDVSVRTPIFTACDLAAEGVKDPYVFILGHRYYMIASYAERPAVDDPLLHQRMHATGDVYNTDTTTMPSGLATSLDGRHWEWLGKIFDVSLSKWDCYQARINSLVYAPPLFLALYDGSSSAAENYEERCGIATSWDLRAFQRITVDAPALTGASPTGSVRYVDILDVGDQYWYYYECTRGDMSHDLRLAQVDK